MSHDVNPYVVHETLLDDRRFDGLRAGEGTVARLHDGSLLMIYGIFDGPSDESPARLVTRRSTDGGLHWTEPKTCITSPEGALNVMSASLLVLKDGRLAMVYLLKRTVADCVPVFLTSTDGGHTWSAPTVMVHKPGYYVANNDRLVQLSTGRLILPYAYNSAGESVGLSSCGCTYSDDGGKTWQQGSEIRILKHLALPPRRLDKTNLRSAKVFEERDIHCQEPGVIELLDGRVMMWARTSGTYIYRAYSKDGGKLWGNFEAIPEFSVPLSPQSMQRLPGSKRIIMLFNDRGDIPFGHPQWQWRRPLTVAVSDDDTKTWKRHGLLEPETVPSDCYYSILPVGDNMLFTYYEGVMHCDKNGVFAPRNLASLKLKIVKRAYFEL